MKYTILIGRPSEVGQEDTGLRIKCLAKPNERRRARAVEVRLYARLEDDDKQKAGRR